MSELFEDDSEEQELELPEDDAVEDDTALEDQSLPSTLPDSRRRLENLMDERRLRDELKDFLDD